MRILTVLGLVWMLATLGCSGSSELDAQGAQEGRVRTAPWPQEVLDLAARIPVQENGRIKPFHTFAGFQMLRLNGKRTFETPWGEKLSPVAWMLDCFFFPEQARQYQIIRVDDTKVVGAIGVSLEGKQRRDRFSYAEIESYQHKLGQLASEFEKKETDKRKPIENQTIDLARKLPQLGYALGFLEFTRQKLDIQGLAPIEKELPGRKEAPFLELVVTLPLWWNTLKSAQDVPPERVNQLFASMAFTRNVSKYVSFLPPKDPKDEVYASPRDVIQTLIDGDMPDKDQLSLVRSLSHLARKRDKMEEFAKDFVVFGDEIIKRAEDRGEYDKIPMEVGFYERDWFSKAQYLFLVAFLCVVTWLLLPRLRFLYYAAWGAALSGEALLITGIVIRCVIKSRPPVTTPYEAILLIIAVGVAVLMFMEYVSRDGWPMFFTANSGGLGLLLAAWHEELDGSDTMQPLVAVLDTNFWLSTHVTTVTIGYCAGILAALMAHVYIFGKLFYRRPKNVRFYSDLSRRIYGVLCFGLLFSTVGTILGGVWANDSWGRFWGWDPKENGALMLCLAFLVVLHARMGGYLREFGIALSSIVIGIVVMWAFWGVNLYQIGLHSYGFTEKKAEATKLFYAVEWSVVIIGIAVWFFERVRKARIA